MTVMIEVGAGITRYRDAIISVIISGDNKMH